MKCQKCSTKLRKVLVNVEEAERKILSFQCPKCDYFKFDDRSAKEVIKELQVKEAALRIKQKITKLSQDRLGIYLNKHIVESLNLKAGEEIYLSVPDYSHIILKVPKNDYKKTMKY